MKEYYGHPNELPEDFGFKDLDICSFIDKLVDDTRMGTLVWTPIYDKNIMWDKLNDEFVPSNPVLKCKIGKHYLYAELSDSIFDIDTFKHNIKSVEQLYTMKNKTMKIYSMPYLDDYEESDYWINYDEYLLDLYKAIEEVHGDLIKVYRQKQAVPRIEILNKFFDLMYQKSDECLVYRISTDKYCDYQDYTLTCFYKDVLVLRRDVGKNHYRLQVRRDDVDSLLKDTFGNADYSDADKRFVQLFDSFNF